MTSTPFHIAHQGLNDLDIQIEISKIYSTLCPSLLFISPHMLDANTSSDNSKKELYSNITDSSDMAWISHEATYEHVRDILEPIRVGFVSNNFYDHSIGRMMVELFIIMHETDRKESHAVEVTVFFIDQSISFNTQNELEFDAGTGNSSFIDKNHRDDSITNILHERLGDRYRRLPPYLPLLQAEISSARIDFLMFTDVGMDFTTYALAHSRLARYQVKSLSSSTFFSSPLLSSPLLSSPLFSFSSLHSSLLLH